MSEVLRAYQSVWDKKAVLRTIYEDFYDRIVQVCVAGQTVEVGDGIGNLKRKLPEVFATDIQFAPWLDCMADAQHLPFADGTISNIVMVDVLHHIEFPGVFFREADRVLRAGGRVIMIEPAITWGSTLFYRLLHHEPLRTSADPLRDGVPDPARNPYDSNQAIPTLIATRDRERFHRLFPRLKITRVDWFSFVVYPLSGGFKPWSVVGRRLARVILRLERAVEQIFGRSAAFRIMLVIEKTGGS